MPNMKKGDDVMNIQPVLVDAMKARGWELADEATTPSASTPGPIAIPGVKITKENSNG